MAQYPHLFQPLKINRFTYRNRIVSAPMLFGLMFQLKDEAAAQYRKIEERAKGGAAAVQIGETSINDKDAERIPMFTPVDYTKYSGPDFDGFKKYAGLIKKHGAVALIEIFHAGSEKDPLPGQPNPRGPVGYVKKNGVVVDQMDVAMMEKASEDFAAMAAFMQAAGFDGVLTHSGHGWLFSQFLSPLTNTRTDKYGGSLENRARFPIEIFERIRKRVGPDFIIEARISGRENVPGGIEPEEVGRFCKMIEGTVDSVHITAGLYMNPVATHQYSSMFAPHGCNVGLSATVKKYTSMPLGVVGGINSPDMADKIIAEGKADFVVLARQMIADPEFPQKAQSGREAEIRKCLRCFVCMPGSPQAGYTHPEGVAPESMDMGSCTINPKANLPVPLGDMPKPAGSRRVLIVGGGAAGMQAAITAAERGHKVMLAEKSHKLGGILNFTDTDADKEDLRNFKNTLIYEVKLRNVDLKLNTEVSPSFIKKMQPDEIILAIGSSPSKPAIPGIDRALRALDVYDNADRIGKRVLMIGGGLVGCEIGLHLAGTGHEVTVIEMLKRLANESFGMYWEALMLEMEKRRMICKTGTRCLEITTAGAKVENENGSQEFIRADTVVYALGMKANDTAGFRAAAGKIPVHEIGDCLKAADVRRAIEQGFTEAMGIL